MSNWMIGAYLPVCMLHKMIFQFCTMSSMYFVVIVALHTFRVSCVGCLTEKKNRKENDAENVCGAIDCNGNMLT